MMESQAPPVALVTGGGRGLGTALCQALVDAGWAVGLTGRDDRVLAATVEGLRARGGSALGVPGDVTHGEDVERVVARMRTELGPVELLINNAGATEYSRLWKADPETWWRVVEVNLLGPFLCARAVLPTMIERRRGRIVNVASIAAALASEEQAAYSASKAALVRLTESLAMDVRPFEVSAFAISPGLVRSDMGLAHAARQAPGQVPPWAPMSNAAELILTLARGELDALSGRFIHVNDDLDALRARAREIVERDLYQLRLHTL